MIVATHFQTITTFVSRERNVEIAGLLFKVDLNKPD